MSSGKPGPCRTPGAVYETKLQATSMALKVMFPRPVITQLSEQEKKALIKDIHDAVLPVVEKLYSRTWDDLFSCRPLAGHTGEMPLRHEEL